VGPTAGLDTEDTGKILSPLQGIEPRSPDRPVRSQTLYCLRYPAQNVTYIITYLLILNIITVVMSNIKNFSVLLPLFLHKIQQNHMGIRHVIMS
jgi:hypothetical protein